MEYKISGDNLQLVTIQLPPDEKIYAEAGSMVYMSANVNMEAKMRGGILKSLGRKIAFAVVRLEGFMQIKLTGPCVVLGSQVIIKSHDPVEFFMILLEFIFFKRLAVKEKKTDIGPGEYFPLYGQHHIVVGGNLIGEILGSLDIQKSQAPVLIDLSTQPDPSQDLVLY